MSRRTPLRWTWRAAAVALALVLWAGERPAAHDIPMDVMVQALLKPEEQEMHVLVRVPMQGQVESLNVSVAAGICLFESVRRRR